jgi:hypothetical protein
MTESHEAFEARLRRVLDVAARELPVRQIAWEEPAAMTRRRWRPGSPLGATAMLLSVVVAAVVAVFALAVLKHGGPSHSGASGGPSPAAHGNLLPTHPSRRLQQELLYIFRAQDAASRRDRACALAPPRRIAPSVSKGSPSAVLLAMLGVLRRPATGTDALPDHEQIADLWSLGAQKLYVRYIRRARWWYGAGYYVIPAGNANPSRSIPRRCYTEGAAVLRRELPMIPKALRAGVLTLEPRAVATEIYDASPHPGVCLAAWNSLGGGAGSCDISPADIASGKAFEDGSPTGLTTLYGLVPDQVATVTLDFPAAIVTRRVTHKRVSVPARSITVKAISNMFIVLQPRDGVGFPAKMIWRAANGRIIKTIRGF